MYSLSPLHLPQVQVPLGGIEMTDTRKVLRMEYTLIIAMRKDHDRMSWKMCSDIWLEKWREDDVFSIFWKSTSDKAYIVPFEVCYSLLHGRQS